MTVTERLHTTLNELHNATDPLLSADLFMVSVWTRAHGTHSVLIPHQGGLLARISQFIHTLSQVTADPRGVSRPVRRDTAVWEWRGGQESWEVTLADLTHEACQHRAGQTTPEERQRAARRQRSREQWARRPRRSAR